MNCSRMFLAQHEGRRVAGASWSVLRGRIERASTDHENYHELAS